MADRLTADDFFAGLLAALAKRRRTVFSIRVDQFDPVVKQVYEKLAANATAEGLNLRFRIKPHPIHRDSLTIQNALARAAQRDLISFDNPEYQDIRIKLGTADADRILQGLPGRPNLYDDLAEEFLNAYGSAGRVPVSS